MALSEVGPELNSKFWERPGGLPTLISFSWTGLWFLLIPTTQSPESQRLLTAAALGDSGGTRSWTWGHPELGEGRGRATLMLGEERKALGGGLGYVLSPQGLPRPATAPGPRRSLNN